jgi:membrane-associated phospholipid phosphatase
MHMVKTRKDRRDRRSTRGLAPNCIRHGSILSAALLLSWFVEPTRSIWLALDEHFFWATNDTLARGRPWQVLWAVANFRAVDLLAALSMVGLYAHYVLRRGRDQLVRFVAAGLMLTSLLVVAKRFADALSVVHRRSPTLIHTNAHRLSEIVPWISAKDSAVDSFPGDHCMVLLICAGVITFYLPRAWAAGAWVVAVAFTAPRLMSGAHWLSDNLVGSLAIAVFLLTWVLATPLHMVITDAFERLLRRLGRRFARNPHSVSKNGEKG